MIISIDGPAGSGKSTVAKIISEKLKNRGRIVVRPSGTEPLIRIMIEGEDTKEIDNLAKNLALIIERILN